MIDSGEVKSNYCALILAILNECSPETAFEKIESASPKKVKPQLTPEDIQDMIKFREEGLIYREIASYYGATKSVIYRKLNPRIYPPKKKCFEPEGQQLGVGG